MESVGVVVAFSAGLLSFLSPCVLPLFPSYLSFITGMSVERLSGEVTAILAGADYLVVGRPITAARDPQRTAQRFLDEIEEALATRSLGPPS